MAWVEITLQTTVEAQPIQEAFLMAAGAQAITYLEAGDQPIWEPAPDEQPMWDTATLVALFDAAEDIEAILATLKRQLPGVAFQVNPLEDKEWTREWMDQFEPMRFGQNLWVCPSWKTPPDPQATIIHLDPGIAFGTGTHPTTALCLAGLESLTLTNKTVIDFGCGSGILAIAACLLGAERCWAVDHCSQALASTAENAKRNGLSEQRIPSCLPDDFPADIQADVIVANILAQPLITLAPTLKAHLKPGGELMLSGLLIEQIPEVQAAYEALGFQAKATTSEEWAHLHLLPV